MSFQPITLQRMGSISEVCLELSAGDPFPAIASAAQPIQPVLAPGHLPEVQPMFFDALHEQVFNSARQVAPDSFARFGPQPFVACLHRPVVASWLLTVIDASGVILEESFRRRPHLLTHVEKLADEAGTVQVTRELDEEAVLLGCPFSGAFHHWVHDVLPLLELPRPWAGRRVKYILAPAHPFHYALLEHVGIRREDCIEHDGGAWRFRQLWYLGARSHHMSTTVESVQWLRQHFLAPKDEATARTRLPDPLPERLYVSRRDTPLRQVKNEARLLERLGALDFTVVDGTMFSVLDQPWLFSRARVVIGPHGGAFALTAFCPPGAALFEFMPANRTTFPFYNVARASALDWYYLLTDGAGDEHGMALQPELVADMAEMLVKSRT